MAFFSLKTAVKSPLCVWSYNPSYTVTSRDEKILILIPLKFDIALKKTGWLEDGWMVLLLISSSKGPRILKKPFFEPRKKPGLTFH